ncbi:pilus assembly protein [uncultured Jannaschia sp.]|uniref:pilus assembly protein n=1 Tax=uncultured Jannaschia sp. TaxID=293347 RepID=UPI0026053875|nr:pilus assembly protein [uncultured Jannaschia sp.]
MPNSIKTFLHAEDGAVSIDWVVLTAALVGLGLAVMGVVSTDVGNLTIELKTELETDRVAAGDKDFTKGPGN